MRKDNRVSQSRYKAATSQVERVTQTRSMGNKLHFLVTLRQTPGNHRDAEESVGNDALIKIHWLVGKKDVSGIQAR